MAVDFLISSTSAETIGQESLDLIGETYSSYYPGYDFQVEVELVSKKKIQELNTAYRAIHEVTDVLSFPTFEDTKKLLAAAKEHPILLGSIIICPDQVAVYQESLPQMVHHGLLHLFGYDHETDPTRWRMAEESILNKLNRQNLNIPPVPYESI